MITVAQSVYSWLPLTQTWLHTQVASLPEDVESHIICDVINDPEQFGMPRVHCHEDERRGAVYFFDRLIRKALGRRQLGYWYRTAGSLRPAVWHSHFADQAWYDREVVKACGARHVLSVYGADIGQVPKTSPWDVRIPEILNEIDLVLCEGTHMAGQVRALGCPVERIRVHHLGIPLERIPFKPRKWMPGTPLKVLIAGSFREKKGIPYAIEALARLSRETEVAVTLIGDAGGKPGDAEEKAMIMKTLETGGLTKNTRLLGFQPYSVLLEESLEHHVFLSPSVQAADGDNEGGAPVTITEMAASGMMIVSSRHCDIPEVVPDGICGLLADERDVDGLVDHLRRLVANPEDWLPMQQKARAHIEQEYDSITQGRRLAAIYKEIAGL